MIDFDANNELYPCIITDFIAPIRTNNERIHRK